MRERKRVRSFAFILVLVVLGLSCGVMSSQAETCDNSLWIKSIWPAIIELDPYTLRIKEPHSFWEITKSNASPYGDYAWGLSGIPADQGPDLYYLHTTSNYSGSSSIYRINLETGKSTSYQSLSALAYGLAQKGNTFYIVYYDSYQMKSVVARVGGEKIVLPESIGGLDYVSDPSGDFLIAISGGSYSHKVYKIPLNESGGIAGTYGQPLTIQVNPGSILSAYGYTGVTHARIRWGDSEREVIYVSKDSGNYEPWDAAAIVDFKTGEVLYEIDSRESGIVVNPPITWDNGVTSAYLSWANPQGLQYIVDTDENGNCIGRLFMVTRYYWNKGPLCHVAPEIDIEKYVSVDNQCSWQDADTPTGPEVQAGNPVYFKFVVTNTGNAPLSNLTLTDTDFNLSGCTIPSVLAVNASFECVIGPIPAVGGQHENTATVTGTYDGYAPVSDRDSAHYYGIGGTPCISIEKSGPGFAYIGGPVTYTYLVTNTGTVPLSNVTVNDDRCGQASYLSGDNGNGVLDVSETWNFTCTYIPESTFPNTLMNTATATGQYGNETVQAQDDYTLYPLTLRKEIFLYWDSPQRTILYPLSDPTPFSVRMKRNGVDLTNFTISRSLEKKIWLSPGLYELCEVNLPEGYLAGYGCIYYSTGQGYPDWTFPNIITFDLAVDKSGPESACPGQTVTYSFRVTNAGPASVVPSLQDDKCGNPSYTGGDANGNGFLDPPETWTYSCSYAIPADAAGTLTNTVAVKDANAPDGEGWILGGDRNSANNTDTWSLTLKSCNFDGEICGTKFADANGNGRRDEEEVGIAGVQISLFSAEITLLDSVDIGDLNSEATHNVQGWGPVEPDTNGGTWGGIATDGSSPDKKIRVAWFKPSGGTDPRGATFTLDAGTSSQNLLKLRALDGPGDDSFALYVNGNLLYSYMGKNSPASGGYNRFGDPAGASEIWHVHEVYVPSSGMMTVSVVPTGAARPEFDTYGQLAVDWAQLYGLAPYAMAGNPVVTGEGGSYCFGFSGLDSGKTYTVYVAETSAPEGSFATTATVVGALQLSSESPSFKGIDFGNGAVSPAIDVEKYVSVNGQATWHDADSAPGPEASPGSDVYFRFLVTNTGNVILTNVTLTDNVLDLSGCLDQVKDPLVPADSFECVVGPVEATEGQHTNTATATGDFGTQTVSDTDDANYMGVQGQAGTTLTATKTASGAWNRSFNWSLDKSATPNTLNLFRGDTGTSQYTITVVKENGTEEAYIEGQICVTNGGDRPTENLQIVDELRDGVPPPNDLIASTVVDVSGNPVLDPGETACYTYRINLPANLIHAGGTYKNTAKITITNHSGYLGEPFGPSPSATTVFPANPAPTNDAIHVDDSNGQSWTFSASGSQTYNKNFTCDADAGTHNNSATIRETGQSKTASVMVNCYSLSVSKGISTSFKRAFHWTIDKSSDRTEVTLAPGETATINYTVAVNGSYTDGDWAASGNITVSNPAPVTATLLGVSDVVSPGVAAAVSCGVSFPHELAPGGVLNCSYTASLPDGSNRTNTATATLQNKPAGTTGFSGAFGVDFSNAAKNEVDETITVNDTLQGPLGSATYGVDALPKTFSYSRNIGPFISGVDQTVANVASFVANDTSGTGSDTANVVVHVKVTGCTYTLGYWKNHCGFTANTPDQVTRYLPIWLGLSGIGKSMLVNTATKAYEIFGWLDNYSSNGIVKLYAQLLAAKLNIANGASNSAVASTIAAADSFLAYKVPSDWNFLSYYDRQKVLNWATTLDNYNNGVTGPGHCPS